LNGFMLRQPLLVVLAGRPGTGKTTLGQALASELRAAFLRIDAIETAVVRSGLAQPPVGPVGYAVAHEIAAATLALGTPVVIDAVNPVPEARSGWWAIASSTRLVIFETVLAEQAEHRRRIEARQPDLVDQIVPTWDQVVAREYVAWDEARDGPRHVIDMTHTELGVAAALAHLQEDPPPPSAADS